MSPTWQCIVLSSAIVLFLLTAFGATGTIGRRPVTFGWIGLALWALVPLWAAAQAT